MWLEIFQITEEEYVTNVIKVLKFIKLDNEYMQA